MDFIIFLKYLPSWMLFKPEGAPLGNPFPEKELGVRTPNPPSHCQRNRGSPNPNPSPQRNQGSPNPNTPPPQQNQVSPNPNLGWVPNPPPLPGNQTRGRLVSRTLRSRTPPPPENQAGRGWVPDPPPPENHGGGWVAEPHPSPLKIREWES